MAFSRATMDMLRKAAPTAPRDFHVAARYMPATGSTKPWELWSVDNKTGRFLRHNSSFKTEAACRKSVAQHNELLGWTE